MLHHIISLHHVISCYIITSCDLHITSCDLILQMFLYHRVAKLLGYRKTYRAGLVVFSIGCILMPLANQISGPIGSDQSDTSINSSSLLANTSNDTMEYSGMGSGSVDHVINDTCHSSRLESSVGGNSIGHIPFRVWVTVCWILSMMILGR